MRIINIFPNCSYLDLSSFVSSYRQLLTRVDDLKEENSKLSYEVLYSPHPLLLLLLFNFFFFICLSCTPSNLLRRCPSRLNKIVEKSLSSQAYFLLLTTSLENTPFAHIVHTVYVGFFSYCGSLTRRPRASSASEAVLVELNPFAQQVIARVDGEHIQLRWFLRLASRV
jgi:hypothetical protein